MPIINIFKRNIAVATTGRILLFSLFISLIISIVSFFLLQRHQQETINKNVGQLAYTVEKTASIATFTNDEVLAQEVAQGLLANKSVKAVRIFSGSTLLANLNAQAFKEDQTANFYSKPLISPFNANETIGSLEIQVDQQYIDQQAIAYAQFISVILFVVIVAIAITFAIAIHMNIIRPIKMISDTLHAMDIQHTTQIDLPIKHENDEIGRLVADLNEMTSRQRSLIRAEKNLRFQQEQAQKRIRLIFEKNQNGLFIADYRLKISAWNSALEKLLDVQLNDHTHLYALLPTHQTELKKMMEKVIREKQVANIAINLSQEAHKNQWVEISIQPLDDQLVQGIISDISNHKKLEIEARNLAEHDVLTGLLNRRGFEIIFSQILNGCSEESEIAILLIDLDGFKYVNDQFGHDAGDFTLVNISRRLESLLRPDDVLARLGGDEFAIVIASLKNIQHATNIADKIIQVLTPIIAFNQDSLKVGASIGIVTSNNPMQAQSLLLKQADMAMYQAKKAGKGCYRIYS